MIEVTEENLMMNKPRLFGDEHVDQQINGIKRIMEDETAMNIFQIDEFVRFKEDQMWDAETIAIKGMIGVVKDGSYICTPGISTMVKPIGANWQFGFECHILERMRDEPTEEEIATSLFLHENRFDIFHERYGWFGLMKIKDKVKTEKQIRREISQLCLKLREEQSSGHLKRLGKILRAFKYHPDEETLVQFAERLKLGENLLDVLSEIEDWNEQ